MIPSLLGSLQALNDPASIVRIVGVYGVGYYIISGFFHHYSSHLNYRGVWRKGPSLAFP
jgi:hypothetical protein